jgi:hypothetical protein
MRHGRKKGLASPRGQLRVDHSEVGLAGSALDEAGPLETLEQAGDPRRRQQQPAREVDALEALVRRRRKHEQCLEVVDRQAVVGLQRGAERPCRDRLRAQEERESPNRRRRLDEPIDVDNCLIRQYLTPQTSLARFLCALK